MSPLVFFVLTSCYEPEVRECAGGTGPWYCPTTMACHPTAKCVSMEQVAACDNKGDAAECDTATIPVGHCSFGACLPAVCGDGVEDEGEQCDDGNEVGGDGCSADCTSDESCGNGIEDPGEQCDAGQYNGQTAEAPCRVNCVLPTCGDGVRTTIEECDEGLANSDTEPNTCRTDCTDPSCGDGVVDAGEACDDGNQVGGDGCNTDCTSDETCGNGIEDPDEDCDAGQFNSVLPNAQCRPGCFTPFCGDGIADGAFGEECDDASANSDVNADACRGDCVAARCGDAVLDSGEACDDGNNEKLDGCAAGCERFEHGWNCGALAPHGCTRCPSYLHGANCDQCAVLVNIHSTAQTEDGSTWYSAFRRIQDGIDTAASLVTGLGVDGCDVWVAQGTYYIYKASHEDTVTLKSHVGLFGGFSGVERSLSERMPDQFVTTLDGGDVDHLHRVSHIVSAIQTEDATVDGFVITGGHARGEAENESGGGLYLLESTVHVANSAITMNLAEHGGAGVYSAALAAGSVSRLTMENCIVANNHADYGGGVHSHSDLGSATASLTDSIFSENTGSYGGGVLNQAEDVNATAHVSIQGCAFQQNSVLSRGGGFHNFAVFGTATASVSDCVFTENYANAGASVHSYTDRTGSRSSLSFRNSTFTKNTAKGHGAGLQSFANNGTAVASLTRCTFAQNTAAAGGGISSAAYYDGTSRVNLSGCVFSQNSVVYRGGGVYVSASSSTGNPTSHASLSGCTFVQNTADLNGGGLSGEASSQGTTTVRLSGCTFLHNSATSKGGGAYNVAYTTTNTASMSVRSTILWGNTAGDDGQQIMNGTSTGSLSVDHSDVQGGWAGTGANNIDADPLFVSDASPFDLHLQPTSPCIDMGDDSTAPITDLEGNRRVDINGVGTAGTLTDMGAYEYNGIPSNPITAYGDSLYWPSDYASNRADAASDCGQFDGTLVAIADQPENNLVQALLAAVAWMGADHDSGTTWLWPGAASMTWDNWAGATPDGSTGTCASIDPTTGQWSATTCTDVMPFMCEQPAF